MLLSYHLVKGWKSWDLYPVPLRNNVGNRASKQLVTGMDTESRRDSNET